MSHCPHPHSSVSTPPPSSSVLSLGSDSISLGARGHISRALPGVLVSFMVSLVQLRSVQAPLLLLHKMDNNGEETAGIFEPAVL